MKKSTKTLIATAMVASSCGFFLFQSADEVVSRNIEALTDSYENKTDSNGNTLSVFYISTELTKQEKEALKSEAYYVGHGLPNPYHYMHVDSDPYLKESFCNITLNKWESLSKCTSSKELCNGEIKGVCWAILYPFYGG